MAAKNRVRVYYQVGVDVPVSTTWQFWGHRTSFYLVNRELGGLKVSLHGRDGRHPSGSHFRVEPDPHSGKGITQRAAVRLRPPQAGWPIRFTGRAVDLGILAVRFRTTASACALPSSPDSVRRRPSSARMEVPRPVDGWAADLDLVFEQLPAKFEPVNTFPFFLTVGFPGSELQIALPDWHPLSEPGFRIRNDHGVIVRGKSWSRQLDLHPTPSALVADDVGDTAAAHRRRGVHIDVDDDGVLWIVEQAVGAA